MGIGAPASWWQQGWPGACAIGNATGALRARRAPPTPSTPAPIAPPSPPPRPPRPGKLQPDAGVREVGDTAVIGYFTQHPPPVDPSLRLVDYVSGREGEGRKRLQSGQG
jgi:hypothetical protein